MEELVSVTQRRTQRAQLVTRRRIRRHAERRI
jgi:hypothetical protein